MDQPALAAHCECEFSLSGGLNAQCVIWGLVTEIQGIGIRLYQFSSGLNGLTTGTGVNVDSSDERMRLELEGAIVRMRGEDGVVMRQRVEEVRSVFKDSLSGGQSLGELRRLGSVLMGEEDQY